MTHIVRSIPNNARFMGHRVLLGIIHMLTRMTILDPYDDFTLQSDLYLRSTPDTIPLHLAICRQRFHNHSLACGAIHCGSDNKRHRSRMYVDSDVSASL